MHAKKNIYTVVKSIEIACFNDRNADCMNCLSQQFQKNIRLNYKQEKKYNSSKKRWENERE